MVNEHRFDHFWPQKCLTSVCNESVLDILAQKLNIINEQMTNVT